MVYNNIINVVTRNNGDLNTLFQVDNIYQFISDSIKQSSRNVSDYAMQVHILVTERMSKYMSTSGKG